MHLKSLFAAAFALSFGAAGIAQACPMHQSETQAMSCSEGSAFDDETGTCVPIASS